MNSLLAKDVLREMRVLICSASGMTISMWIIFRVRLQHFVISVHVNMGQVSSVLTTHLFKNDSRNDLLTVFSLVYTRYWHFDNLSVRLNSPDSTRFFLYTGFNYNRSSILIMDSFMHDLHFFLLPDIFRRIKQNRSLFKNNTIHRRFHTTILPFLIQN